MTLLLNSQSRKYNTNFLSRPELRSQCRLRAVVRSISNKRKTVLQKIAHSQEVRINRREDEGASILIDSLHLGGHLIRRHARTIISQTRQSINHNLKGLLGASQNIVGLFNAGIVSGVELFVKDRFVGQLVELVGEGCGGLCS